MFLAVFFVLFLAAIISDLVKGLSANGTPPILQKFPGQLHVAYFMWSSIRVLRILFGVALIACVVLAPLGAKFIMVGAAVPLGLMWWGVYWFFNKVWSGRVKFPAITSKVFASRDENTVPAHINVIGIDQGGARKAYPTNMVTFHHQIVDSIGDLPIWVTYCGLCRSGRVYDLNVDGMSLDFTLVGAISFNATFEDNQTGTWWRQETGEAAKGKLKGRVLEDVGFEQMTLENWLQKYPDGKVLQYDQKFVRPYTFIAKLHNFEATKPAWHMQETPDLIVGVEIAGVAKGYDWEQLKSAGLVVDEVGDTPLVLATDLARTSASAYSRQVEERILDFTATEQGMTDTETGSTWDWFGTCLDGPLKGKTLTSVQSYQQYVRAWIQFHPNTTFYDFG